MRIYLYYDVEGWPWKIMPGFLFSYPGFRFRHLIVDSGVNRFFRHERRKDYPPGYLERYLDYAKWLTRMLGEKVWVVLPDYPGDYPGNPVEGVTERTIRNVERFIGEPVNWVVVIQARHGDVGAFEEACRLYRDLVGGYPRVAVGTLCTRSTWRYAYECCRVARRYFPGSWIHVFGPSVRHLPYLKPFVDSIDSVAYWRTPGVLRGRGVRYSRRVQALEWVRVAERWLRPRQKLISQYTRGEAGGVGGG